MAHNMKSPSLRRAIMKFPGSKLLHQVDLSNQGVSLGDVLRSCQQVGLTGFAEVRRADAMGMIFYYLGGEVTALFREGQVAHNGQAAVDRLRGLAVDVERAHWSRVQLDQAADFPYRIINRSAHELFIELRPSTGCAAWRRIRT